MKESRTGDSDHSAICQIYAGSAVVDVVGDACDYQRQGGGKHPSQSTGSCQELGDVVIGECCDG